MKTTLYFPIGLLLYFVLLSKSSLFFFLIYLVGQDLSSGMWELVP